MKKRRRLLAALLALTLVLGLAAPIAATGDAEETIPTNTTEDVKPAQEDTPAVPETSASENGNGADAPTDSEPTDIPDTPDTPNTTDPDTTDPTEPTTPTEPTEPTDSVDPTDPAEPTDPTAPAEPTDPVPPEPPAEPVVPVEPVVPPAPTQEELEAAQKAQEEAERLSLLERLKALLPEEDPAVWEGLTLEELRAALAQAEEAAQKAAEEAEKAAQEAEKAAQEAAERRELVEKMSALFPEGDPAVWEAMPLAELRAALAQAEEEAARKAAEEAERQEIIQELKALLPEEDHAMLEELTLEDLRQYRKMLLEERPMLLADAVTVTATIENPPPIQVNPYDLPITDGVGSEISTASIVSKPCLITNKTALPVEVTAVATARPTGGAQLMNESTRSDKAKLAHQTDERNIFLFLELQTLSGPDQLQNGWTTDPTEFKPSGTAVIIPRSGESDAATILMPAAASGSPAYAAFKIGGDCSVPSYFGEWKEGAWTNVGGAPVQGEADGAEITIVFTFTPQAAYSVSFVVKHADFEDEIINPDQISVTAGGEKVSIPVGTTGTSSPGGPVTAQIGEDFVFHVQCSDPPTVVTQIYSSLLKVDADSEDGSYHKTLFDPYVVGDSYSETLQLDALSIPAGAKITITITVFQAYYPGP